LILRWFYKLWIYLWISILSIVGFVLISVLLIAGALQLPASKNYLKTEIETTFNNQFEGTLEIESITGWLPFEAEVSEGNIFAPADSINPVLSFQQANVTIGWWELLQQNLSIQSFEVEYPELQLSLSGDELTLLTAFKSIHPTERDPDSETGNPQIFNRINLFAPQISVVNGRLNLDESIKLPSFTKLSTPLTVENLNSEFFLEITESQFFVDILSINADLPGTDYQFIQLSGQFFNDRQFFELNSIELTTAMADLNVNLEASPVNLFARNLNDQFKSADYRFNLSPSVVNGRFLNQFISDYPLDGPNFEIEVDAEGDFETMFLDRIQATLGESSFLMSGELANLLNDSLSYDALIENIVIHPDEKRWLSENFLNNIDLDRYNLSTIRGEIYGSLSESNANLDIETGSGSLNLDTKLDYLDEFSYELLAEADSIDITPFLNDTTQSTVLQGRVVLVGRGLNREASFASSLDLNNSRISGIQFSKLIGQLNYDASQLNYNISADDGPAALNADGSLRFLNEGYHFIVNGNGTNVDVTNYSGFLGVDNSGFNGTFSVNLQGSDIDDMYGRISVEVDQSFIGRDTLRAHQLYADISDTDTESRTLRFTSSFFDGELSGTLKPTLLRDFTRHWSGYLKERYYDEIAIAADTTFSITDSLFTGDENPAADLSLQINLKDMELLAKYFPDLPDFTSRARLTSSLNVTKDRFLLSGNLYDEFQSSEFHSIDNLNSSLNANFQYGRELKESGSFDFQLNNSGFTTSTFDFKESFINISLRNNTFQIQHNIERLQDDLQFESSLSGILGDREISITLDQFELGTSEYSWQSEETPVVTFSDQKSVTLEDFIFSSESDYISINGTYSSDFADSVEYSIQNLNLNRISNLIGGRIQFSGIMNGQFETRTLNQVPSIQGSINIDEGRIMDRLIGDVTIESVLNTEQNQFDTRVHIYTDPDKYSDYLSGNNNIGQDLELNGFFKIPENIQEGEDLFRFDANFEQIDMWIVTFIVPSIIEEMEGSASGSGFIRGTEDEFDFESRFEINDVFGRPIFTNVGYTFNGALDFNKTDGLLFRDIQLRDNQGGTGSFTGQVDLQDFAPTNLMDLTLSLNNLHFMNNSYDPEIPFYASLYGSGQVRITGTNLNPYLRTTTPVSITSNNSTISIPLQDETEFDEDRRFIEFVDTFDLNALARRTQESENGNGPVEETELTFLERFTMDLQFNANNPLNVQLVFDRVTNEILSANGTGQVRLLLEDQEVSMFGRFNIESGEYQFVSGDIFTRRFTLQEGGSLNWQGDLTDANLDVTAIYRARPVISSLLSSTASSSVQESGQRIPVELVLQIGGNLTNIENDFFFRIPTGIEGTMDPTIATQISNLNQNEDEKLLQATSILISGNFIPSDEAQGFTLGDSFSGTAALVSPLITSQLINPLLSNQINSLLQSDVTFDVDFNLNAFNEVDLGVALRLFDDRVILRREGQITGEQSDIGDIGATYQINRTFSLTAFHRQDPTLTNSLGTESRQTQEMNGVGIEAQVQFNTWREIRNRISNSFRTLFGLRNKEEEETAGNETDGTNQNMANN
jgi:hypothetical protein